MSISPSIQVCLVRAPLVVSPSGTHIFVTTSCVGVPEAEVDGGKFVDEVLEVLVLVVVNADNAASSTHRAFVHQGSSCLFR